MSSYLSRGLCPPKTRLGDTNKYEPETDGTRRAARGNAAAAEASGWRLAQIHADEYGAASASRRRRTDGRRCL